jgi:cation diffusion facilitator family transporter
LKADAWHHRSDAISSIAALIGIAFNIFGGQRWHFMDHLAAFVVAAMIIIVGIKFFKRATADLMDENIPLDKMSDIKKILLETPGALDIEAISARRSGLGIHVDVHLEVDPSITVKQGHDIASDAKRNLKKRYPAIQNVLVHIEPYYPNDH